MAAVLGVLEEIRGAGGDAAGGHQASLTFEGGGGEDVVVGGDPFVDPTVSVDLFEAGVEEGELFSVVGGEVECFGLLRDG